MAARRIIPGPGQESVWDYPRPPSLEDCRSRIRVVAAGTCIADSKNAKRVLETSHPPVYYLPPDDIGMNFLQPADGRSFCEWKGEARYYSIVISDTTIEKAAWFYPNPTSPFSAIKDHVAFFPAKMDACFVGDERVAPQEGGFYGGWITSNIVGPFKGGPGTSGW